MQEIDPLLWYGERRLKVPPVHFIKTTTPISTTSLFWVQNKLKGRFSTGSITIQMEDTDFLIDKEHLFFEDPSEATIYELRWAGSK